ncbi:uncharacterized protein [Halyomorpha halys]|uniref:uncharacterized protein n=1 Tax=Halyomorpha halys TaxID=286706 RepID=UPI0006D4EB43
MLAGPSMTVLKLTQMEERKSPEAAKGISFSVAALLADSRRSPSPEEEDDSAEEELDVCRDKSPEPGYSQQRGLVLSPAAGPIRPTPFTAFAAAAAAAYAGLPPHGASWPVHHFPGAPVFPPFHGGLSSSPVGETGGPDETVGDRARLVLSAAWRRLYGILIK